MGIATERVVALDLRDKPFRLGQRPALDGLRGVAILLVVALHYSAPNPKLDKFFSGGFIGVEVFFVLSGFLITSIILEEVASKGRLDMKKFYKHRAFRLAPALYAMVLACAAIGALGLTDEFGAAREQATGLFTGLTYLLNVVYPAIEVLPRWARPLWSLCVEVHFYLIWPPVLAYVAAKRPLRLTTLALATIVGSVAYRMVAFYALGSPAETITTPSRVDGLALGALVAIALHRGWQPPSFTKHAALIGAGVIAVIAMIGDESSVWMVAFGYSAVSLSTAAILIAALDETSAVGRVLMVNPLRLVGRWSYSWYLWHIPVLVLLAGVIERTSTTLTVVALLTSFGLAGLSTQFLEIPLRRFGRRVRAVKSPAWGIATGL